MISSIVTNERNELRQIANSIKKKGLISIKNYEPYLITDCGIG